MCTCGGKQKHIIQIRVRSDKSGSLEYDNPMHVAILLAVEWQELTVWLTLLNVIAVGATLFSILSLKKDSTSAVAWCMTVIFLQFIGVIFYWLFGYQSIHRPLERKRRHSLSYKQRQRAIGHEHSSRDPDTGDTWQDMATLAERLGASPLIGGNRVELYFDGRSAFDAILSAIRSAKHHINMEFFIFRSDELGQEFLNALAERAKAGVQVRFLYDAVGSWSLKSRMLRELQDAGGKIVSYLTLTNPLRQRVQVNLRNHRKIVVIDGTIGFTGGFNIGDEYLGKHPFFGPWRDTFLRLEGPAAHWIQQVFVEDWSFAAKEDLFGTDFFPKIQRAGSVLSQIAWSGPDQTIKTIREIYFAAISRAKERVWIASPYFVPDVSLLNALCLAARSGRDVRLLVPFRPDKWLPFLAARFYWQEVLPAGVKIYQYTKGFMHAKMMIVDDVWASVGSANFDNRSLFLNFEMTCLLESKSSVEELEEAFLTDFSHSIRVDWDQFQKRGAISRLAENACRLFSPIL